MSIKHYDVVRAASPSDLAEKLTHKLKEGWQPFGSPVAITPYTLMQAIAAEGDVTTPVLVKPSDGRRHSNQRHQRHGVLLCCGSGGAVKQHGIW
ncbi:hypothetical protein ECDEC10B_1924 [Escherichia coli DEC10B]|nr:hypothetical protein ECDEC10B_1924 [Escherichia coli DEC10B]